MFYEGLTCSLELKADLLLSSKTYKLVFFKPGDSFQPEKMVRDGDIGHGLIPRKAGGRTKPVENYDANGMANIKLCLFPALYAGPAGKPEERRGFGRRVDQCVVQHRNFIGQDDEVGAQELVLVAKAVVLT